MRAKIIHSPPLSADGIGVQSRTPRVKFDPPRKPRKFRIIAPKLWRKPAAAIVSIEKCSLSTAKRILRGDGEISLRLGLAILDELQKPAD